MRFPPKAALVLVFVLAAGVGYYYFGLFLPRAHEANVERQMGAGIEYGCDLYPIWLTGRDLLLHRSNPYTPDMTTRIQIGLYGRPLDQRRATDPPLSYRAFAYPLYIDVLAIPLLPFSFPAVRMALCFLFPLFIVASVVSWAAAMHASLSGNEKAIAVILTIISYPVLEGLYAQQPALIVGLLLAAGALAIGRGRPTLAGVLVAFASVKPQLFIFLAVWLLSWALRDWPRRKGFVIGFALTLALLIGVSEVLVPGWHRAWYDSLLSYRGYTPAPLSALVFGKSAGYFLIFAVLVLAVTTGWKTLRSEAGSPDFTMAFSTILAAELLLLPSGVAVYDQVVLIPAVLLLWGKRDAIQDGSWPIRVLAVLLLGVIAWPWITANIVAAASLAGRGWAETSFAILLPLRTAASLPFVVLAVLACLAVHKRRAIPDSRTAAA